MKGILLACGLLGLLARSAQADLDPDWTLQRWSVDDGLPVNNLTALAQTPDGRLWIATFGGLVRFDGLQFEVVPQAGQGQRFTALALAPDGRLFASTEQAGLVSWQAGVSQAHPERVHAFIRQPDALWIGTDRGLARVQGDQLVPIVDVGAPVYAATRDAAGRTWIGTDRGLLRLEGQTLVPGPSVGQDADGPTRVHALALDGRGRLWVGTGQSAWRLEGELARFMGRLPCLHPVVFSLAQAKEPDVMWAGTACGLARFSDRPPEIMGGEDEGARLSAPLLRGPAGEHIQRTTHTLWVDGRPIFKSKATLSAHLIDRDGAVWATSMAGELFVLRRRAIDVVGNGAQLAYGTLEDRAGDLWVASLDRGVEHYRPMTPGERAQAKGPLWTQRIDFTADCAGGGCDQGGGYALVAQIGPSSGKLGEHAWTLVEAPDGTIWVGHFGLCHLEAGLCIGEPALDGKQVRALAFDRRGRLWAGTNEGLFVREGGQYRLILPAGGAAIWVQSIEEAADGGLWMGTNGLGLLHVNTQTDQVTRYGLAEGLPSTLIRAIWTAPDGSLWLGSENRGLIHVRWRGSSNSRNLSEISGAPVIASARAVDEAAGLPAHGVHRILADARGRLWMNSDEGIFWVDPAELEAVELGLIPRLNPVRYDTRDGLPHREGNGGVGRAGIRLRDGRLVLPTQAGVAILDPATLERELRPPMPTVERVASGEARFDPRSVVTLGVDQRDFTVTYTASSFRHPEQMRFYTQVRAGTYRFEVQAAHADGIWSPTSAVAEVVITPHFYELAWLRGLALAAVLLAISAGFWMYFKRLRAREARLAALVAERTREIERQAEALRSLDALKGRFFAHISHELRTPLTLITASLDELLEAEGASAHRGALEVMRRNAHRLARLTNQILELERPQLDPVRPSRMPLELASLVRAVLEGFQSVAEQRHFEVVAAGPAVGWVDAEQMETVLINLVANAVKFTEPGGHIRVAFGREGREVWLTVEDNGCGIAAVDLPHIFDRFYRVRAPGAADAGYRADLRVGEGTGLGLALVAELVRRQGGRVTATSALGVGTCLRVVVPAADQAASSVALGHRATLEASILESAETVDHDVDDPRARVLVVDDNPDIRHLVGRVLSSDYAVLYADDGVVGLRRTREALPDLVVADIMMPGLDGIALARALAEDPETASIPVLLLTARADAGTEVEGLRAGAVDYLSKPFKLEVLRARVEAIFRRGQSLRDALRSGPSDHRDQQGPSPPPPEEGLEVSPLPSSPAPAPPSWATALVAAVLSSPPPPVQAPEVEGADEGPSASALAASVRAAILAQIDHEGLDVAGLARAVGMSRATLTRRLAQAGLPSPAALIRTVRLQRAHDLLRAGAGNVSEVAYAVGFRSLAHFSRAFKEEHQVSPSSLIPRT